MHKFYATTLLPAIVLFVCCLTAQAVVPAGYYYFAINTKGKTLKTALHDQGKPIKEFAYGGGEGFTWEGFYHTDRNTDNSVVDMYSDSVRYFNGYAAVNGMHIEHSFPKSWWGGYNNGAYKDLFHLYPADGVTNSTKNDLPLGEVGTSSFNNGVSKIGKNSFGTGYSDNCFEPADEFKGDFARSYLYIATVYEELGTAMSSPMTAGNSFPFWKPWAIDLLKKWNAQDPVSEKERTRNETIYKLQGNRNPFIDYPDMINYIWGTDSVNAYPFPNETSAFLIAPRRGNTIDMGAILVNDSKTKTFELQGLNVTSDLKLELLHNSPNLKLSATTISPQEVLAGITPTLTFTPTSGGLTRDTILITGGGMSDSLRLPVKALASTQFATLEPTEVTPIGGTLNWMTDPFATNYRLNIYQGDQATGDLMISGYVEGSSWNKAIELYNGTGKSIDLSDYSLQKQSNGMGNFGSTQKLSGTLASGQTYTIVHKQAGTELYAKANLLTDSILQFNGNDAVILLRGGIQIDMVGKADAGADVIWGENLTLKRKSSITHPISTYNQDEWQQYASDDFSAIGAHTVTLATSTNYLLKDFLTHGATAYTINGLQPDTKYTYSVESMRSGVIASAVNTMQLRTSGLDAPVIMEPEDITATSFVANWEQTLYADGYLLDVYTLNGNADTTVNESFDAIGTSGTPLPTGWSGTASGSYTSTTSAGVAPPSIALKSNNEWLQTTTYPSTVTKLTFMYKFASAATGSSLALYGLSCGSWVRVDSFPYLGTSKNYPTYNFEKSQGVSAFKFIYHKSAGNLSIDDISVTYGAQDSTYILKNSIVTNNAASLTGLKPNTQYFYRAKATLNNYISASSETMDAITGATTDVANPLNPHLKISMNQSTVTISGLQGDETIRMYTSTGFCLKTCNTQSSAISFSLPAKGMYIISIRNNHYSTTSKYIY